MNGGEPHKRELQWSNFERTKAERRVLVALTVRRWRMLLMRRSSALADLQMFLTCLSMVVLDEIMIPRCLA